MHDSVTAIIPAKGISSRLPNKNILPFGDSNLLIHKIRQLKQVERIGEIIVSSEDDNIIDMALKENVRAIKRPYEYANETLPFQDFLYYIVGEASENHIMWACCTSPMVDTSIYNRGCELYFEKLQEGYDSLITVMEYRHYILDKNMKPYTFRWGPEHRNSQELDELYFFTDGIQLAPKSSMRKWRYYFGHNPYGMKIDLKSSLDIDTMYDYLLGRMEYYINDDEMHLAGVNPRDGEAVYSYVLAQMVKQISLDKLKNILAGVDTEKIRKILQGLLERRGDKSEE